MGDGKYIYFNEELTGDLRKTSIWAVHNRTSGTIIGWIRWYGAWRQYCFFPHPDTVWSEGCLADVKNFIKTKMMERTGSTDKGKPASSLDENLKKEE